MCGPLTETAGLPPAGGRSPGAPAQMNAVLDNDHVPVWRSDVDPAGLNLLIVDGVRSRKRSGVAEYVGSALTLLAGKW